MFEKNLTRVKFENGVPRVSMCCIAANRCRAIAASDGEIHKAGDAEARLEAGLVSSRIQLPSAPLRQRRQRRAIRAKQVATAGEMSSAIGLCNGVLSPPSACTTLDV
ncbi:hypothetical protein X772_33150 [Mesorhizobium sp. LSJC280B00]|nr:hypothetical protein X772_33150 [Mesorhizobium sp. LSJC280B00]